MKLIVGLGNPGRKYAGTRHNVGFEVLAELVRRFGAQKPKAKFDGELAEAQAGGERVLLLTPLTYMNNSGACVQPTRDFYKIENPDVLIVCDDVSLPVGKIRLRPKGSSGGQKGLKDIIQRLGTEEVPRLRLGIGAVPEGWIMTDYVLSKCSKEELPLMREAVERAADAATDWVASGIQASMNKHNASTE